MLRKLLLISIAFTLSACATHYIKNVDGVTNGTGYQDIPIDSTTYRIVFYGSHAGTSLELVDRYAFYRAAELTEEKGYDYFVIVQTGADEKQRIAWNTVRMSKVPPTNDDFAVFDAQTVIRNMTPFIQREGSTQ